MPDPWQCDACAFVSSNHAGWETNVLGETLCPRCVERAWVRAGQTPRDEEDES